MHTNAHKIYFGTMESVCDTTGETEHTWKMRVMLFGSFAE